MESIDIVGEAPNGRVALTLEETLHPDVILMDLVMPEMDGISTTQALHDRGSNAKVIVLTSFTEDEKIIPAIQAGATSFLLKDVTPEDLVDAIHAAYHGEARLHPTVARKLMDQLRPGSPPPAAAKPDESISPREMEVLVLVADCLSNQEIADKLVISEKTVKTHVSSLLTKLNLKDRTQLAVYAIKQGYVHPQ
jgi:NarL family two-component system response regulator LiaR